MSSDYSRQDMSYAVRLANRGFKPEMIYRALAAKPSGRRQPGSIKYQRILDERGKDAADAYAWRTTRKAASWVKDNPPARDRGAALEKVLSIKDAADALPWFLYGGAGARRALEACFVVAERVGGPRFGLSLREWGELSGQGFEAVRTHRQALGELSWLVRDSSDRPGRTGRYTLRIPKHVLPHSLTPGDENVGTQEGPHTSPRLWLPHDAFREESFGDPGWLLLYEISRSPNVESLPFRTGLDLPRVMEWVGWFQDWEIVRITDDNQVFVGDPASLERMALKRGTDGQLERDKEQHRQDREDFRARGDVNVGAAHGA